MAHKSDTTEIRSFSDLGLNTSLLRALEDAGYEQPTPIQAEMIPHVMQGKDVIGQAQTGTGKTAAFALPLLSQLRTVKSKAPQILVLTPTRELAIQVAESFKNYGKHIRDFRVLPVFGGQDYSIQLKQLKRGVQVVVGTPGRIMDHIRQKSLQLGQLTSLVLDEGDEMLKMGFIDDIEWILEHIPAERQTALFSATMPGSIRRIAQKYLKDPVEITIKTKTVTATTINQRYLVTHGFSGKHDALAKILESEDFDGMLIFARTKIQTVELAERLVGLGYNCAALNGDIQQSQRIRTVEQLKSKKVDILVATDVAARGLDVERISHVVNFDIPFDTEAYIHRIGRTGRAGRTGEAILFVHPRERSMLKSIERVTKQKIGRMELPSIDAINKKRVEKFKENITTALESDNSFYQELIKNYLAESDASPENVAAALAQIVQGNKPLLLTEPKHTPRKQPVRNERSRRMSASPAQLPPDNDMDRYRIEVGKTHGVKPGNIVGAIANEADISSKHIGRISIFDDHSTVDLPTNMPERTLKKLQKVWVNNQQLHIQKAVFEARSTNNRKKNDPRAKSKRFKGRGRQKKSFSAPPSV